MNKQERDRWIETINRMMLDAEDVVLKTVWYVLKVNENEKAPSEK